MGGAGRTRSAMFKYRLASWGLVASSILVHDVPPGNCDDENRRGDFRWAKKGDTVT